MRILPEWLSLFMRTLVRWIFRRFLPLFLLPPIEGDGGSLTVVSPKELRERFGHKNVLVVGGTKGIGASIVDVLRESGGAKVTVVGRSARLGGIYADLSTVQGCLTLVDQLAEAKAGPFEAVVFTVGVWPDFQDPYTKDGIHKVVALDLLARHVLLTRLEKRGLLNEKSALVLSVLASGQNYPSWMVGGTEAIRSRMKDCCASREDPSTVHQDHRFPYGKRVLFDTSVCHDAWLQHVAKKLNAPMRARRSFASTFPGLLVSDVIAPTVPGWLLPMIQTCLWFVADTPEEMGWNHATILSRMMAEEDDERPNHVSYWVAPFRKAYPPSCSCVSSGEELGEWTFRFLEDLVEKHSDTDLR